jgi:hypothetical protein
MLRQKKEIKAENFINIIEEFSITLIVTPYLESTSAASGLSFLGSDSAVLAYER